MRCRLDPHPGKRRSAWIKTSRALVEDMGEDLRKRRERGEQPVFNRPGPNGQGNPGYTGLSHPTLKGRSERDELLGGRTQQPERTSCT